MKKRLRQIADTIHKTVYLSELESNMMSTAYFYRLHDVYQSSTVYLTFPGNRTKRYEHSYGTMELAGEMFFSAITNASDIVLKNFFTDAEGYLKDVVSSLLGGKIHPTYCNSSYKALSECFTTVNSRAVQSESEKAISEAYKNFEQIEDAALNHYMPPFSSELAKRKFLYQCLLESVRIVALFHDIGHPPYSHIMESVLNGLYAQCVSPNAFNQSRAEELISNLKPFKEAENDNISCLLSVPLRISPELHEQVGLKMLAGAFDDIFQIELAGLSKVKSKVKKGTAAVYYVAVAEFCFAILREQTPFFTSLHRIVDGCVDADRMDYIVRDSHNSGVDWGTIPYKRMLESCKMAEHMYHDEHFYVMAFPRKMAEHIDDLLITRYKIFSRINYHHRSYKTALILQRLVRTLAEDYLSKGDTQKALCPGIADLWNCLSSTMNSGDLYIIQWNDSTLISHLYQTLVEVKSNSFEDYGLSEEQYDDISNMLEEFLLNRKHFYSVFKRQSDFSPIFASVFVRLQPLVDQVKKYEQQKLQNAASPNAFADADDSLKRLNARKIQGIINSGDGDALQRVFPLKCSMRSIILEVLAEYKEKGQIGAYLFDENKKRSRTGLPSREDQSDGIYLYETSTGDVELYNVSVLEDQLVRLQNYCLQYIAYIEPREDSTVVIHDIRQEIANRLYNAVESSMKEMFSCLRA
ncbi:MAG: hypothetical protein PUB37_07460 [Firmicutes bacterium]|nr:hypothetical protein [Bacillota bacterium]